MQATDRLAMIQQMGRLVQQVITTLTFSAALAWESPWLVLLLMVGVIPSFVGETHYAFLGYAKNFRQTPAKRQMDYLRQVAGSREGAKEVKLFGLNKFFTERFQALAHQIYLEDVALSKSKLVVGGLLGVIGTLGYYGAYVYVIWRTIHGAYNIGQFTFPGCRHSAGQLESAAGIFDCLRHRRSGAVSHRSDRLLRHAADRTISKPDGLPHAEDDSRRALNFAMFPSLIREPTGRYLRNFNFTLVSGRTHRPDR